MHENSPDDVDELPSKSERKRAAQAAQELGEQLVTLSDAELDALDLPERLRDAIDEAKRITSRAAAARQRQFIGRLMREIDLGPIRAALAERSRKVAAEAQRFRRIETWRERLIAEGPAALEELAQWHPDAATEDFARHVAAARAERSRTGTTGPAARELFRALRALFERSRD